MLSWSLPGDDLVSRHSVGSRLHTGRDTGGDAGRGTSGAISRNVEKCGGNYRGARHRGRKEYLERKY